MDDHTGKIIQFSMSTLDKPSIRVKELIESWGKYLGLEIQRIELQSSTFPLDDEMEMGSKSRFYEYQFEEDLLHHTFYDFENGYGFGNNMMVISTESEQ